MNYETVKQIFETEGEIFVRMDSGKRWEFHLGDVECNDDLEQFYWDAGTAEYWIDGNRVESVEVHRSGPVSE